MTWEKWGPSDPVLAESPQAADRKSEAAPAVKHVGLVESKAVLVQAGDAPPTFYVRDHHFKPPTGDLLLRYQASPDGMNKWRDEARLYGFDDIEPGVEICLGVRPVHVVGGKPVPNWDADTYVRLLVEVTGDADFWIEAK